MSQTTGQFKKQLPKNALMSALAFGTHLLSAIWLTPYLVHHLGTAAYGLIPIAGLFTQYVSIITANLSSAVNRFLTIELQKPGGNPNSIFNSSLALYSILILIQIPLFALGLFYADNLFSIPPKLKTDTLLLLGCSAGGFLVSLLNGVFGVSLYSKNRLDISSSINIGRLIIRLVLIVLLFAMLGPKLRFIGYIDLCLNVLMLGFSVFFWKRLTPELTISFRHIQVNILKPIFCMSFWTLFNSFGALLYQRSGIWIVNRFISPVIAGQYAATLVIANFVRQLAGMYSRQIGPTTMKYWAQGELNELRRLLVFSIKMLAFGIAIPIALICIYGDYVLTLWLGEEFSNLSTLLTTLTLPCIVTVSLLPLFGLQVASNSVKWPAVITFLMGIANVALSYYMGVVIGMGAVGVGLATAIMLALKNAAFTPIYGAHILGLPFFTFVYPYLAGLFIMGFAYLCSLFPLANLLNMNDLPASILQAVFIVIASGLIGWFLFLSKHEKHVLTDVISYKLRMISRLRSK